MADKRKAKIIITRGRRSDLRTSVEVLDKSTGQLQKLTVSAGPSNQDIDRTVLKVKEQLERSGVQVDFKEM